MRLYEFVDAQDSNAMAASIVAVSNQLQQHVEDGSIDPVLLNVGGLWPS